MRPIVDIVALKAQAERAALAQEDLASRAEEDSQHWHHVMLANLIRTMAALISDPPSSSFPPAEDFRGGNEPA